MTELGDIFVELGVSQYLDAFVEHGFDTWETILDITESDLWVSNFPRLVSNVDFILCAVML